MARNTASVSDAPTWPGQQNWSVFRFQSSASEYRPAPQEHQGMPGPHPNLSSIQNQPANHYSAVPHFQSAVPQWRPADQEQRRSPRPHPYLPIVQNQPVNYNSRIPHSQPAIPQKRPAGEEQRRLQRPQSLLSNVQNQPGHQDSAVRHLQSTLPQKRPADQEERRVQTRSLLHTAPRPPRKPRSKTSRDPFSDSEDSPELLEPSMGESREQNLTPNTIPKRMVETAPSGERKLSLDRPKLGPRPLGYKPAHAPQGDQTLNPRRPWQSRLQNHPECRFTRIDKREPAATVDDAGDKPLGALDNEFGLPRT